MGIVELGVGGGAYHFNIEPDPALQQLDVTINSYSQTNTKTQNNTVVYS